MYTIYPIRPRFVREKNHDIIIIIIHYRRSYGEFGKKTLREDDTKSLRV